MTIKIAKLYVVYSLTNWIFAFAILLALSSNGICQQIISNLEPGQTILDLGEGYNVSFYLANSEKAYDVEVKEPEFGDMLLTTKSYGFIIYTLGGNEELAEITLNIHSTPKKRPVPKPSREDREFGPLGIRAITPKIIDGATGFVGIDWPKDNTATNMKDAVDAFFYYYPGAKKTTDGIETYIEVLGQTGAFGKPQALTVFQSLLDTIHLNGLKMP